MEKQSQTEHLTFLGLMVSLALIVSYVETLIPFPVGIPGAKIGLTNIVILIVLYRQGFRDALLVSVVRIFLAGFLFGNLSAVLYSLAGGLFSLCVMQGLVKSRAFGILGVSTAGGVSHNIGQLILAAAVLESKSLFYYMPFLTGIGVLTGAVIGTAAGRILKYLKGSGTA